jgi:hypothetical protein
MMTDVAIAIDGEAVNVSLARKAAGTYSADGDFTPGAPATSAIRAAIQPASGKQLMDVPEGIRQEAGHIMWSRSELRNDDTITHDGSSYRVLHIWPRPVDGGFYRAAIGKVAS